MWRKMRVDAPADRMDDLVAAAESAGLELDDWGIDAPGGGWRLCGSGQAFVTPVVDDDVSDLGAVCAAIRAAHERTTGDPADWITPGGSFVFLPDGMESEWYDHVGPVAERLHAAEARGATQEVVALRAALVRVIEPAMHTGGSRWADFAAALDGLLEPPQGG